VSGAGSAARPGGKEGERGKTDNRGPQDGTESCWSDWVEEVPPSDGPEHGHDNRNADGPDDQVHPRMRNFGSDARKIRAAKKPREKGNRQKRYQRGTDCHSRGPTQYIRLVSRTDRYCCVRLRAVKADR